MIARAPPATGEGGWILGHLARIVEIATGAEGGAGAGNRNDVNVVASFGLGEQPCERAVERSVDRASNVRPIDRDPQNGIAHIDQQNVVEGLCRTHWPAIFH